MTTPLRTKSKTNSQAAWPRVGTTFSRLEPIQRIAMMTATARSRMRRTRFSSNGVPSKRTAGGKNSSIEGPWNPPSPDSAANGSRVELAVRNRVLS